MKKLSILAFAMGLIDFTACSEKKAPAQAPAPVSYTHLRGRLQIR